MYDNISKKLKTLAKYIFGIGLVLSIALGIFIISYDDPASLVIGICVIVLAPMLFWISSSLIYAIGDISEKVEKLNDEVKKLK